MPPVPSVCACVRACTFVCVCSCMCERSRWISLYRKCLHQSTDTPSTLGCRFPPKPQSHRLQSEKDTQMLSSSLIYSVHILLKEGLTEKISPTMQFPHCRKNLILVLIILQINCLINFFIIISLMTVLFHTQKYKPAIQF